MEPFQWWYGRNASAEEYGALVRSVCEQSCADIVHNRWATVELDWCCLYYFVRNSLVALLEALCARYQDPWARDPGGRTGAIKAKKIHPKQIPRIQSKLDAIMRPIAQQIITDINEEKCMKKMGLRCVFESRVATVGMLMHKNPLCRDNLVCRDNRQYWKWWSNLGEQI